MQILAGRFLSEDLQRVSMYSDIFFTQAVTTTIVQFQQEENYNVLMTSSVSYPRKPNTKHAEVKLHPAKAPTERKLHYQ